MSRVKTLQQLFKRYRRPGDIVFAWVALVFAVFLLSQIGSQTKIDATGKIFARPWFWPAVSLTGMSVFAAFHLLGSALSERIRGRRAEIWFWAKSLEYAVWFVAYAIVVPRLGYLPSTMVFAIALTLRAGYRKPQILMAALGSAAVIVLLFKTFLQVRMPSGQIYEFLPDGLRQIMLTNF